MNLLRAYKLQCKKMLRNHVITFFAVKCITLKFVVIIVINDFDDGEGDDAI